MAKKETMTVNKQAWEFFVYATLGIVPKEMFDDNIEKYKKYFKERFLDKKTYEEYKDNLTDLDYDYYRIIMCAKAAYNDLSRTLRYDTQYKSSSKDKDALTKKENIINCVCAELTKAIYNDGNIIADVETLFKVFVENGNNNECLSALLDLLLLDDKTNQKFHFGQIQKWVNMTLKYLYLLSLIDSDEKLHIPIDSYIIDAAWEINDLDLPLKDENANRQNMYNKPSDYVVAWSKWTNKLYEKSDKGEYDLFQEGIQKFVELSNDYNSALEWEHENWIRISEKRKGV